MKPEKSSREPLVTFSTVSSRTVPRSWSGSKITEAESPNDRSEPGSVRETDGGTLTVEVGDGDVLGSSVVPPSPMPHDASTRPAVADRATAWITFLIPDIRSLCTLDQARPCIRYESAAEQALGEVGLDLVEADPVLLHRVPLAHGHLSLIH